MPEEHIIVIDDDEMVNEVLTFILQEEYEVNSYLSAEDVLKDGVLNNVDVIITDVNLPGIDGIEFLCRVNDVDSNLPVIVITGFNDIDIAISALKNGAFDFILKPFKNDQIILSVKKAIERRFLLLENIKLMKELKDKNNELEILNQKIQKRNLEMENELDYASDLQQCIFPLVFPKIDKLSFALKFKPVEKVSGDFFDFTIIDDKHFSFLFADVSGHGVPAALYSAMVKTAISSLSVQNNSPSEFLTKMNRFLIGSQKKMSYSYANIFYCIFNLEECTVRYCNAGIPSPVIIRNNSDITLFEPNGPFVGIFDKSEYFEDDFKINEGDKLIFYTDGAFECSNRNQEIMTHKVFLESIENLKTKKIDDIVSTLFANIKDYCGTTENIDDITILGIKYG